MTRVRRVDDLEFVGPLLEESSSGGGVGGRERAVVESVELFEGWSDVDGGEAWVEVSRPVDDGASGVAVLEGLEVGEVAAFGSVEDGEDLAGGEVSGVEQWNAVDDRGGEEAW